MARPFGRSDRGSPKRSPIRRRFAHVQHSVEDRSIWRKVVWKRSGESGSPEFKHWRETAPPRRFASRGRDSTRRVRGCASSALGCFRRSGVSHCSRRSCSARCHMLTKDHGFCGRLLLMEVDQASQQLRHPVRGKQDHFCHCGREGACRIADAVVRVAASNASLLKRTFHDQRSVARLFEVAFRCGLRSQSKHGGCGGCSNPSAASHIATRCIEQGGRVARRGWTTIQRHLVPAVHCCRSLRRAGPACSVHGQCGIRCHGGSPSR